MVESCPLQLAFDFHLTEENEHHLAEGSLLLPRGDQPPKPLDLQMGVQDHEQRQPQVGRSPKGRVLHSMEESSRRKHPPEVLSNSPEVPEVFADEVAESAVGWAIAGRVRVGTCRLHHAVGHGPSVAAVIAGSRRASARRATTAQLPR
jgi:hypothetical protein